jgi:hypothetical protein
MELAHHASFAGRKLVLRLMDEELGSRESKIAGGT